MISDPGRRPLVRLAPLLLAAALAWAGEPPRKVVEVRYLGGTPEDRGFAASASGLRAGEVGEAGLRQALDAIRATDRFSEVRPDFREAPGGAALEIHLEAWPALRSWTWEGDPLEKKLRNKLFPGLFKGSRVGAVRLELQRTKAEQQLKDAGHPVARVEVQRGPGGATLAVKVTLGPPALLRTIEWEGDPAPYTAEELLRYAKLSPGRSLWTSVSRRDALAGLRKRFLKDRRYEWQGEFTWHAEGNLRFRVLPGPRVDVALEGDRIRWIGAKDLLPFLQADRFSPDLLDQGDRRIALYLNDEGYKDAKVTHRREPVQDGSPAPGAVRITYTVEKGEKATIDQVVFEKNREISSDQLLKAAAVPRKALGLGPREARPDLVEAIVERVKGHYLLNGYPDATLRRRLETQGRRTRLVINVREGQRRFVASLELQVPAQGPWDSPKVRESLLALLGEREKLTPLPDPRPGAKAYRTERKEMGGAVAVLEPLAPEASSPLRRFALTLDHPIPLVKADLALVMTALRQEVAHLGTPRPLFPKLTREEGPVGERITVEVAEQPLYQVRRLAVRGSEETRPDAVLREADLAAGKPLDPQRLTQAQSKVGSLGAFDRVELHPLAESSPAEPGAAWAEGDLLLDLQERPHWVYTSGFGYDSLSGYHFLGGAQRLNFQGMGRTLDFSMRAGDATLDIPWLRKVFPTGPYRRSLDVYSVGYTDPRFLPGWTPGWLPDRTSYRAEGAYLDELQTSYEVRRRRLLNSFAWKPISNMEYQVGYRFERVEVSSIIPGLSDEQLNALTKTPGKVVISAPWVQWAQDRRDKPTDPTSGYYTFAKLEIALQALGTSTNASFVKLDLRQQWNWPLGTHARWGIVTLAARIGLARPTANTAQELPLSERFFAGGPGTNRGVEPNFLGPLTSVPLVDASTGQVVYKDGSPQYTLVSQGGQGLALVNLEYRFPLSPSFWLEVFVDSGQVYKALKPSRDPSSPSFDPYFLNYPFFPPFRTTMGLGLIMKVGIPIKIEYARDVRRIFRPSWWNDESNYRTYNPTTGTYHVTNAQLADDHITQLRNILISAGFQF